jgi:hypothetical protein
MNQHDILNVWIPYRLQAIDTMLWAYSAYDKVGVPGKLEVIVDGKMILGGHANAILNPMIEAGFIHARSLLEFLGLKAKQGRLVPNSNRNPDDIAIEHFEYGGVPLQMVSPTIAIETYQGPHNDAERALVAIFELANKGAAHLSSAFPQGYTSNDLDIACRGIRALVQNNLYTKLNLPMPEPAMANASITTTNNVPTSAIDSATIQAFRETHYCVGEPTPITLRIGQHSEELIALHTAAGVRSSAFITAWNPFSQQCDESENAKRQAELMHDLTKLGLRYGDGVGRHPSGDWEEPSLFVLSISLEVAQELGIKYEQNAILWCGEDAVPKLVLLR